MRASNLGTSGSWWSKEGSGCLGADIAFEAVGVGATVAQAHGVVKYGGTMVWIGNNVRVIDVDIQQVVTTPCAGDLRHERR